MVMFLSDVVQKIDGVYYYLDKVGSLWDDIDYNNLTKEGNIEFPNGKKPIRLLQRMIALASAGDDLILDFFAGSGSTAHAVMQQNAEDGGNRRFILVQLPESCDQEGFSKISDISKERLRRAGKQVLEGNCSEGWRKDVGFRAVQVDTSNMSDVYYSPDQHQIGQIDLLVDNIKPDRSAEDLLFQVMLDWGVDLAMPIAKQAIQGKDVFLVDGNAVAACFDGHGGVDEDFVKELAKVQPLRVVFRDAGFKDSSVKINVEQIFKLLSPATEVKCI